MMTVPRRKKYNNERHQGQNEIRIVMNNESKDTRVHLVSFDVDVLITFFCTQNFESVTFDDEAPFQAHIGIFSLLPRVYRDRVGNSLSSG